MSADFKNLVKKVQDKEYVVGIMGLGYVGLPLAIAFGRAGVPVLAFDIDEDKISSIKKGVSYIKTIDSEPVKTLYQDDLLRPTSDPSFAADADVLIMCVPTPLNKYREPDLSYVEKTAELIVPFLRKGQVISLESTTYPGTTVEIIKPILAKSGLNVEKDLHIIYSPEREDPGNKHFSTSTTPKVVGAEGHEAQVLGNAIYGHVVEHVVPVSSSATAEAVKLTENIFRCVNIALVNELKILYDKMGIDVWEVIDAAKTKPFGFMPFYPGPGLGGHCIPIDPFYLTWKAREFGVTTRFIELAGQINNSMPDYVMSKIRVGLDTHLQKSVNGARILLVGLAYKKDVDDVRESPSFPIFRMLKESGANIDYYDPYVAQIPSTRENKDLLGYASLSEQDILNEQFDAAVICTDHSSVDYDMIGKQSSIIIDTRNSMAGLTQYAEKIIKA